MEYSLEVIVFFILLIDAIGANLLAWSKEGKKWWKKNFRTFSRNFPLERGWTTWYLLLVLWIGYMLHSFGVLG